MSTPDAQFTYRPKTSEQAEFYNSTARYPGFIGPWGNGKTLSAIMKGMALSQMYINNEGLVTRSRYNALVKTTMKDFTDWTGIPVSETKQVVDIGQGTTSRIHFLHSDDLPTFRSAMQGMNLGWAYIEQGDEHPDGSIFDEIKGRMRRIITPNDVLQDRLIACGAMRERIADFRTLEKDERDEIEDAIVNKLHLPLRQIMVIANAKGHNWMYDRWHPESKKRAMYSVNYHGVIGEPGVNAEFLPKSTIEDWETLKTENPRKYARCVLNSFEDYEFEGSFYSDLMSVALKEGRVECEDMYDNTIPVYTFWDLGVGNETAIWFVQFVGESIKLVDYYAESGQGMAALSRMLDEKPYTYNEHWLPHDARQRQQGETVTTRLDTLRRLRPKDEVRVLVKHLIEDRIEAVRGLLGRCRFSVKCEDGVECLNKYHREINKQRTTEETTVFTDVPAKEYSDGADAFGYMCMAYRHVLSNKETGRVLGYAQPDFRPTQAQQKYDPFRHLTNEQRYTLTGTRR